MRRARRQQQSRQARRTSEIGFVLRASKPSIVAWCRSRVIHARRTSYRIHVRELLLPSPSATIGLVGLHLERSCPARSSSGHGPLASVNVIVDVKLSGLDVPIFWLPGIAIENVSVMFAGPSPVAAAAL